MLVDTHCHISSDMDIDEIITDCKNKNVGTLILGGCARKDNMDNISIASRYNNIYATVGFHPDTCNEIKSSDLVELEKLLSDDEVIAIGEIGLDYHYGKEDIALQKKLFNEQLKLADRYNMPVVIHTRDAVNDTIEMLKNYNLKGVIHCFSGSYETACKYIDMGYKLGIGGVITFKNSNLKDVVKKVGLENIVLETDSPYLSPIRGEKNTPSNVSIVANFIAELFNISLEEVINITNKNVKSIFNINCI